MVSDRPFVGQKKVEMGWMEVQRGGAGCVCVCVWVKWTCAWKKKEKEGAVPAADRVSNRTAHGGALWMGSDEDY
jgi:hypothetical protein